jgi:hypothetical protein
MVGLAGKFPVAKSDSIWEQSEIAMPKELSAAETKLSGPFSISND